MKNNSVAMRIAVAKQQGVKQGRKQTIRNYSAAVLLCLKDKFGFTTEQLQEAAMHINDIFSSIGEGYLSLKDIEDTLKEENDIDIVFITAHAPYINTNDPSNINPFIGQQIVTEAPTSSEPVQQRSLRVQQEYYTEKWNKHLSKISTPVEDDLFNILGTHIEKEMVEEQLRKAGYLDD